MKSRVGNQKANKTIPDGNDDVLGALGLSKRVFTWAAVGLAVSTVAVLAISILFGVNLSDIEKIGYVTFFTAAAVSAIRLVVQIARFRLVARSLVEDPSVDLHGFATARMGSEFVALSTPSMSGGEIVRGVWLSARGVELGKAFWIGYFELIANVYVASALGLLASAFAFSRGALLIGTAILSVVLVMTVAYTCFFVIPAMKGPPKVPEMVIRLATRILGRTRARNILKTFDRGAEGFSIAARAMMRREALPLVAAVLALTVAEAILVGVALWVVLSATGMHIDLFSSMLAAYGGITIAAIPVSIGGSGITELATQTYLSSVFGFSSWAGIVLWRVASFQIVLVITGVAFLLLIRKGVKQKPQVVSLE